MGQVQQLSEPATGTFQPLPERKYLFFSSWPVRAGSGVNNVILGLSGAMEESYAARIVITGWQEPTNGQLWLKMPSPTMPGRNLLGFAVSLIPNMMRLSRLTRGAIAVNPHYFGPEILPLAILRRLGLFPKLILSVHGADVAEAANGSWLERRLYAWICRSADSVVACSNYLASEVRQISPSAKVISVWNGTSRPPQTVGKRPLEAPYLVSVAAFVQKKGHDVLLRAFQQISAKFPNLKLILIGGEGPERSRVSQLVEELGLASRVQILVNLPHEEIWDWVGHAECFVHAAREEPFGIAVLEAGSVRTPVVTTAVGGIPEYLINGLYGFTCQPNRPDELAAAVIETLSDPEAARNRAAAFYAQAGKFTWEAAWERYREAAGLE